MNKKPLLLAITSLLLLALAWMMTLSGPAPSGKTELSAELRSPPTGGDFTVDTVNGPISLSDFKGKAVVLYFGYTLCPDICPTSLGFLSAALKQLDTSETDLIQSIFVSVDPDRDGLEHLDNYAKYFDESMIGATASKDVIDDITYRYGASYRMVETESSLGYLVDHSAAIYFIDKQGKLYKTLPHGTLPSEIVETLRGMIK